MVRGVRGGAGSIAAPGPGDAAIALRVPVGTGVAASRARDGGQRQIWARSLDQERRAAGMGAGTGDFTPLQSEQPLCSQAGSCAAAARLPRTQRPLQFGLGTAVRARPGTNSVVKPR